MSVIQPCWPAPANVHSAQTTRLGGVSQPPFASLNLGTHVGDNLTDVAANRARLAERLRLSTPPLWLEQVHGTRVLTLPDESGNLIADAVVSHTSEQVCTIMTADCLPVLFCDTAGSVVAAAHAGWRGLAAGVLEATLTAMQVDAAAVMAWLGPAIGPSAFEVGGEVRAAFMANSPQAANAFVAHGDPSADKWLADIYQLARLTLGNAGVSQIYGGEYCTYTDSERFFSYRRDQQTGRQASLIWLE
ncbi:peptidoglycan editing factor PgeF [Oceanisphaera pacifica]|uniref:Purine nucleoside phosphorylase n=1 Tax=Oceanisphaera pacifica TaxID=2818389 RepID=A0ABS3NFK9_9GAMM|nr:peptidoglycan editing factor PgeF [Oceanisphaera pacifica]MBO1519368.1 peptidoglycan editing factor PgeF [Oceanisphaera pacifica]